MCSDVKQRNVFGSNVIQVVPATRDGDQQQTSGMFLKAAKTPKANNTLPFFHSLGEVRCHRETRAERRVGLDLADHQARASLLKYLIVNASFGLYHQLRTSEVQWKSCITVSCLEIVQKQRFYVLPDLRNEGN